jgi:hypothetical protein
LLKDEGQDAPFLKEYAVMPAGSDFNLENLAKAVTSMSLSQAGDWLTKFQQDAAGDPGLAALVEEAFVKNLKSQSLYADMISSAASDLDTGRSKPDTVRKMLGSLIPGMDSSGIEGVLRKDALIFSGIAKIRGSATHPSIKLYADESAKFSDDDFKNLGKPLRLLVQTISKAKSVPIQPVKRAWVGDKPKA